ncbi:MAG: DUF1553 domain-containing protein [Chryseolinea sp.]
MLRNVFVLSCVLIGLVSCKPDLPEDVAIAYRELPEKLDYNIHVKPVLSDKCFACHGPDKAKQKAGLRLDLSDAAKASLPENPSKVAIHPGDPEGSEVFHRIISTDPDYLMPSPDSHLSLSSKEKAILIKWIEDGAEYKPHWAWVKPQIREIPKSKFDNQATNPIDHFIFETLEKEELKPSKQADKELLLRRVTLDLTGLPPTLAEIDAFVKDNSPVAYEKQVDRLLNSPHYGEKMAVQWLDLARFADSHGYTVDRLRDMSPYRDWVIQAFNKNYPYNKFIQWQLAGDLMPKPTREMILATAFNRNHQQNLEGGIIEEEFQTEYVMDRTNTFGEAFMGLSVGCARCHDHKYDPISQKNYYEIFSFFNNVREAGQISWDNALPTPTLLLPTEQQEKIMAFLSKDVEASEKKEDSLNRIASRGFTKWISSSLLSIHKEKIPSVGLVAYFPFDDKSLRNKINSRQSGEMRQLTGTEKPVFNDHEQGDALSLNGDIWLDLKEVGIFRRMDPFSIGLWVYVPKDLKEGVIFHKSNSERLYNFRGYHLYLKENTLEMSITHTAPSNAITKRSYKDVPRDQWIQLTMTYDGSSKATGMHLYLDGSEMPMEITMDQLTKDILLYSGQPGLQIGAWDRGWGLKNGVIDDLVVYNRELSSVEAMILSRKTTWTKVLSQSSEVPTKQELKVYYQLAIDPDLKMLRHQLWEKRKQQVDSAEHISEVMVMQEMTKPKKSYLLQRGNYSARGEEVFPNTPESILAFNKNLPRNRLGLAQWLTDKDHPLTARVAVNRFWQNFFGTGLVKTSEDFGNQGSMPSHPELLDWLALSFQENGWDMKKLQKLIAMSTTYRQDSRGTHESSEKDPENRWLSHGPALRLTAEMIRDNALMACGLMQTKIGGKSVMPYQPDGLWEINNAHYDADTGRAVYRRSVYVVVKRTVPNPTLSTFDAPSRSYCVVRRQQTNTPLQSLVTLNDPTFIEACSVLGEQMTRDGNGRKTVVDAYRKLTGRTPSNQEIELLMDLQKKQYQNFEKYPTKTKGWLNAGQHKADKTLDSSWTAANTVVASTILNSDATLTKR